MIIFNIRIVYKSGYTHDFECTEFKYDNTGATWNPVNDSNRPIKLGINEVAAIWQIGFRKVEE